MADEPQEFLEEQEVEYEDHHHSLMEIFEELSFKEKWQKVAHGLKEPPDSGEHKWAKLQVQRLSAPLAALIVPIVAIVILMTIAVTGVAKREIQVEIIEPEQVEDLEEIEELIEEFEPPEPVEMDMPDDVSFTEVTADVPSPPQDFSPAPAELDSVALTRSPVIMRGILGTRNPGARGALLAGYGGGKGTEAAVLRALRWLKKNQNDDGSWNKTKPAMTGLALLTFLAHGETPASEEFGSTVEAAIKWLVNNQNAAGMFKNRDGHNYSHPIATYALCEAFAMTKIPMVKYAAEKAMDVIIKGQHESGGWDYNCVQNKRDDTSYMGWCAQALKAAYLAGLEVEEVDMHMRLAVDGFRKNYKNSDGYGGFGYTSPGMGGLTGVGVLCMQLLGAAKADEVRNGLNTLEKTTFNWDGTGTYNKNYYWYYITQAKFHVGGDVWNRWNRIFSPVLVKEQTIIEKERSGYVDHKGIPRETGWWEMDNAITGHTDGEVMDTCLCALQLQVYYRYLPTFKTPKDIDEAEISLTDDDDDIEIEIL